MCPAYYADLSRETKPSLTTRQIGVLKDMCDGLTAAQCAVRRGISEKTVEYHRARIKECFRVETTSMLIRAAIRHGYIKP